MKRPRRAAELLWRSALLRAGVVAGLFAGQLVLLFSGAGTWALVLVVVPAVAAGLFFGPLGGLLMGIAGVGVDALYLLVFPQDTLAEFLGSYIAGGGVTLAVGVLVGVASRLNHGLRREVERRVRLERDLRASNMAAQAANAAKSSFLTNVSHELRTPLNGIIGLASHLKSEVTNPEHKALLAEILGGAESLHEMVNGIISFSRIEAGKHELRSERFAVRHVVESATAREFSRLPGTPVEARILIDPEVPETVVGDPAVLSDILAQLVSNAVKYTHVGTVSLHVSRHGDGNRRRPPRESPQVDDTASVCLLFQIIDTGIGMSEETRSNLFDPFSQGENTYSKRYRGTGLGLALTRLLVGLLRGRIWVESREGEGSTFSFTAEFALANGPEDGLGPSVPSLRIAAVSTDTELVGQLRAQLGVAGHEFRHVGTLADALALAREGTTDLFVIDDSLEEATATELAAVLGDRGAGRGARAVMVGVAPENRSPEPDAPAIDGVDEIVTKPLKAGELQRALSRAVFENRAIVRPPRS